MFLYFSVARPKFDWKLKGWRKEVAAREFNDEHLALYSHIRCSVMNVDSNEAEINGRSMDFVNGDEGRKVLRAAGGFAL